MPPFLPGQVAPEPRQARQQMLKLRQFDLQLAFPRAGALREDVEDERRPVEHLALETRFQVAALGRGEFVVEDDRVHLLAAATRGKFVGFAAADERAGHRRLELLDSVANDFATGGGGQFAQFVQGILQVRGRTGF